MPEEAKFNLRLPPDLYLELADEADYTRSSRNAVIIAALRSYLPFVRGRRPKVVAMPPPGKPLGKA